MTAGSLDPSVPAALRRPWPGFLSAPCVRRGSGGRGGAETDWSAVFAGFKISLLFVFVLNRTDRQPGRQLERSSPPYARLHDSVPAL